LWYQLNTTNGTPAGPTTRWLSAGGGNYTVKAGATVPSSQDVLVSLDDINGDGRADVTWSQFLTLTSSVTLTSWITQPDGTIAAVNYTASGSTSGNSAGLILRGIDFNGDGIPDFLIATPVGASTTWLGNGDGTYRAGAGLTGPLGYFPHFVDINGDGNT